MAANRGDTGFVGAGSFSVGVVQSFSEEANKGLMLENKDESGGAERIRGAGETLAGDTEATEGGGAMEAKAEEGEEDPYRNDLLNKDEEPKGASKEWLVLIVVGAATAVAAALAADASKDKARGAREGRKPKEGRRGAHCIVVVGEVAPATPSVLGPCPGVSFPNFTPSPPIPPAVASKPCFHSFSALV